MNGKSAEDWKCRECGKPVLYRRDHDPACMYYVDPNQPSGASLS